jgi:hypothetical protein
VHGPNPACSYSARLSGLPRVAGWATAWRPGPTMEAAPGAGAGRAAARLARVLRRTRCPRNCGVSTVRAAATCLTRWWWRWLTRAAARRAGAERRWRGDVPRWRRRSGHGRRRWWGPAAPEEGEKVRHTPLVSHDAWSTRLTEGGGGRSTSAVARSPGGEAVR